MSTDQPWTPHEIGIRNAFVLAGIDVSRANEAIARVRRDAWAEGARAMVSGASTEWIDRENPYKTEDQT